MKLKIGVNKDNGLIHSVETTAAKVDDLTTAADIPHGEKTEIHAESGYQGMEKRLELPGKAISFRFATRPVKHCFLNDNPEEWLDDPIETALAAAHPFPVGASSRET